MINKADRPASLAGLPGRTRLSRVQRRTPRRGAKKFLTLTAVVGLVFAGLPAAIAQAAPSRFADGFEGNPAQRWEPLTSGDGRADFDLAQGLARSGADNGWLYAGQGWAAQRIAVPVGGWPERSSCVAEIYAQPVGGGAQVALEIWDPNGWHKLTSTAPFLPGSGYQRIRTSRIDLRRLDTVYVQAIFGKDDGARQFVRLDDVSLRCS
ncbi:hypothetical protein FXF51_00905 [Nonomuraea sp. PA05]|uniref:hypothetical protein n=1 Tax=Nonomuraea sp. PA05 TaxID=2604466 RepID=UPI0011DA9833|nr:hypothetical protein [Nonomuraea sp. PA05]TYB71032.1 hypothetical protein FXF51_00905 [Nonomuraea sp. PA05]